MDSIDKQSLRQMRAPSGSQRNATSLETNMIRSTYILWIHDGKRYRIHPIQISHTALFFYDLHSVLRDGHPDTTMGGGKSDDISRLYTMREATYPMDMLRCYNNGGCTVTMCCVSNRSGICPNSGITNTITYNETARYWKYRNYIQNV
jgi:hypothetical protein